MRGTRIVGLLFLAAVTLSGAAPVAADGPVKIGLLVPLTGALSAAGKEMQAATELSLAEIGKEVAGRKIELLVEDTEGNPAVALGKARKLVEQDKVHVLTGGILASTGYMLHTYIDSQKIPATYPVMAPDDLTQRKPAQWVVRTGWSASQPMHPFGEYVARTLKHKKVATIGMDYAFGWETVGGFQRSFEEAGGQVVQKIWTPTNAQDLTPFLSAVKKDVDAVFALFIGPLAVQFTKAYQASPVKGKPVLAGGTTTDESILAAMGDEAVGIVTALHYSAALPSPATQKFVKAFEAKVGKVPSYYAEGSYTNARWIVEAARAVGGKVEDRDRFLAALRKVEIKDGSRGPVSVDRLGNPVQNIYVRKVERVNGKLQNTVIHTFPGVSQFWKYGPDEYLKQPLYNRDYPRCAFCS